MTDLLLDELTHDLVLVDGDLAQISEPEEVRQRIKVTFLAQAGEWLFDTDFGVPYRQEILVKAPDLEAIEARLRGILAAVEGVTAVLSFTLSADAVTRRLTVDAQVDTAEGETDFSIELT